MNQMFKKRYDEMCFDCGALAGNFGREGGGWFAHVNVFSLILLMSCLRQPENIPALKYSVNIPEGVFSLLGTLCWHARWRLCC